MIPEEIIAKIKVEVHLPPNIRRYEETMIQNETNCYSYAIGSTFPCLKIYRIGAIFGKKDISERYNSISELVYLLKQDLNELGLEYQSITDEDVENQKLQDKQYIVCLYAKFYRNSMFADYHFIRYEDGIWSEKWKNSKPRQITSDYYEGRWEWKKILTLKITR